MTYLAARSVQCDGKISYTRAEAHTEVVRRAKRRGGRMGRDRRRPKLEAYQCPHCGAWHVGTPFPKARPCQ